jgi:hypothetical protein
MELNDTVEGIVETISMNKSMKNEAYLMIRLVNNPNRFYVWDTALFDVPRFQNIRLKVVPGKFPKVLAIEKVLEPAVLKQNPEIEAKEPTNHTLGGEICPKNEFKTGALTEMEAFLAIEQFKLTKRIILAVRDDVK